LNILDGVTATTAELNILDGVTATTAELNILDGVTATTAELNILDGVTATAAELNILDGLTGVASQAEAEAGTDNTKLMTPLRLRDGLNATGSAPVYACRAWVNFNGTGTVAIRASGNVSSITDNGTGNYTVNFTTAMPDANYAINGFAKRGDDIGNVAVVTARNSGVYSTSAVEVLTYQGSWTLTDFPTVCVSVFR
jgi:hypothetical protein